MDCDYLIVGAGFFGSVLAERIANDSGDRVIIIDKRSHIGGNCYSEFDKESGIEFHRYGTHIFHTSSKEVWNYIIQFTEFNGYRHQVLTTCQNKVYQMPINLETINSFFNLNLKPQEAKEFMLSEIKKGNITNPTNLEEKAISVIGRRLYEAFVKGYTIKQWGIDPKKLPSEIISRIPVRYNYKEDYFVDALWQGIPIKGYTRVFERMLDSSKIVIKLNCDYFENHKMFTVRKKTIYTGPIDKFFQYKYGKLDWRSVDFEKKTFEIDDYQGTSVMNYADLDVKYTRIHEPKHLHPERQYINGKTIIFLEISKYDYEEPYYPINNNRNNELVQQYQQLAQKENKTIFGGRLGNYSYYDMDKTILAALNCYDKYIVQKSSYCLRGLKARWFSCSNNIQNLREQPLFYKICSCIKQRRLPYFLVKTIKQIDKYLYFQSLILKTKFTQLRNNKHIINKRKFLYASPVGINGKKLLEKIIQKFGYSEFDFLIFIYDETDFKEEIFKNCNFIREKGLKWQLGRKYLTATYCNNYEYIFFWDDDIDIGEFNVINFINLMRSNKLELAQPALTANSYYSHEITTVKQNCKPGRFTDFVEIMVPVFDMTAWGKFYDMIKDDTNVWGWGYDEYSKAICKYTNMGIIDSETVIHTKPLRGTQVDTKQEHEEFIIKHRKFRRSFKVSYMKLNNG